MSKTAVLCRLSLFAVVFALQSCFLGRTSTNEPLDHRVVASIKPGASAKDVVQKMGAPDDVVQLGRRTAYRYSYSVDKGTGSYWILLGLYNEDTRRDMVWFFFDEKLVLTHVGSTFHGHRASFAATPWSDLHDPDDAKADDAERGLLK